MASKPPPSELAAWLAHQRWFASKTRRIRDVSTVDRVPVGDGAVHVLDVTLDDGRPDRYAVPLLPGAGVRDALDDGAFCRAVVDVMARSGRVEGERGAVVGSWTGAVVTPDASASVRRLAGEQSNTSVTLGSTLIVKHFRRLTGGVNPEIEIPRFLTAHAGFAYTPRLAGTLEYHAESGEPAALAVAQELVTGARDTWAWLLERLAAGAPPLPSLRRLGERTAALHLALATPTDDPAFAAEPIRSDDIAAWRDAVGRQVDAARAALGGRPLPEVSGALDGLAALEGCRKLRHHGDYHLGQTLYVARRDDVIIIDFEGEPLRAIEERRRKHTPLRDVAGMLRSLHYAAASARAEALEAEMRAQFLAGYGATAHGAPFLPAAARDVAAAVAALELEKAAYEIVYEANNRPDWVEIPIRGFLRATSAPAPPAAGAA